MHDMKKRSYQGMGKLFKKESDLRMAQNDINQIHLDAITELDFVVQKLVCRITKLEEKEDD